VNAKDNVDCTPLHLASNCGHVQVVTELLEHGADTEATNIAGSTPLRLACGNGRVAVVIELLSPSDSNGATTSILGKRKIRGEANVDAKDDDGDTPLHGASAGDHLSVVKALLSGGADIFVANNQGELPVHKALNEGRKSAVSKYLLQHYYAIICHLPLHHLLHDLTWIGNPYSRDAPPLHEALDLNVLGTDDVVEILEYLIDRNPELITARDQDGSLPLHVACRRGASFAIVQSLVNLYEASIKSVTSEGDLPLFLACELPEPCLDTIFLLVKLYPDLVY
jgi:ankyrin repeat protein